MRLKLKRAIYPSNFGIIYGKSGVTFAKDLYYDASGKNPKKTDDWEVAKSQGIKLVEDYLNTFSDLATSQSSVFFGFFPEAS